jgi:NADH-quinone oxidoreductase subunit J
MDFQSIVFYFFYRTCVGITLRDYSQEPVHAALFLVLAFFTAGGIWMLLHAEFLAIA